jgi:hypothetical protein
MQAFMLAAALSCFALHLPLKPCLSISSDAFVLLVTVEVDFELIIISLEAANALCIHHAVVVLELWMRVLSHVS